MKACPTCGSIMARTLGKHGYFFWCPEQKVCKQKTISDITDSKEMIKQSLEESLLKGSSISTDHLERPLAWVDDVPPRGEPWPVEPVQENLVDPFNILDYDDTLDAYGQYEKWGTDNGS